MNITPYDGDDTGMQTRVWGPAGWLFLHSVAQNYPWSPTEQKKEEYLHFFRLVGKVLPCKYCRQSYDEFITQKDTLLNKNALQNRKTLITWLWKIHNKVNNKLGIKDGPTLDQVFTKYESFRSKCSKTVPVEQKGCTTALRGGPKKCKITIEPYRNNSFGSKKTIKLLSIKKSNKSGKKMMATFETNGRKKVIHFGASGMSDYTKHKDISRRNRYIFRHHKDLGTNNPARAGYLSMFVLWNKKSLQASIADYKRRLSTYNRTGKFPNKISGYKRN